MREERKVLTLDPYEQGIVVTALNDMRNGKLREHQDTAAVDDVLLKAIDAPSKKIHVRDRERDDEER